MVRTFSAKTVRDLGLMAELLFDRVSKQKGETNLPIDNGGLIIDKDCAYFVGIKEEICLFFEKNECAKEWQPVLISLENMSIISRRLFGEPVVTFSLEKQEDDALKVHFDNAYFLVEIADFPIRENLIEKSSRKNHFLIDAVDFSKRAKRLTEFTDVEDARAFLHGVHIISENDKLFLESSNGFVGVRTTVSAEYIGKNVSIDAICPAESITVFSLFLEKFFSNTCGENKEKFSLYYKDGRCIFSVKNWVFSSPCIGVDYPDMKSVLSHPRQANFLLEFKAEELISILSDYAENWKKKREAYVSFIFDEGLPKVSFFSDSIYFHVLWENVCRITPQENFSINEHFMLTALQTISSWYPDEEKLVFRVFSHRKPIFIELPEGNEKNKEFIFAIMPMVN